MDTASIDIQRPRSPFQNISGYGGFRKRLAGEDDGLAGGLEGGAPAFPLAGGIGGWGVRSPILVTTFPGVFYPQPGRAPHTLAPPSRCFCGSWGSVSHFFSRSTPAARSIPLLTWCDWGKPEP